MTIGTLTSKGQITIPSAMREQLRLKTGDRIEFRIEPDGTINMVPLARRVTDVIGMLSKHARKTPVTLEEMNRLLDESFRRKNR
jgi:antitoxin PrlF